MSSAIAATPAENLQKALEKAYPKDAVFCDPLAIEECTGIVQSVCGYHGLRGDTYMNACNACVDNVDYYLPGSCEEGITSGKTTVYFNTKISTGYAKTLMESKGFEFVRWLNDHPELNRAEIRYKGMSQQEAIALLKSLDEVDTAGQITHEELLERLGKSSSISTGHVISCGEITGECSLDIEPVCGRDAYGKKKTYANACQACSLGAKSYEAGSCLVQKNYGLLYVEFAHGLKGNEAEAIVRENGYLLHEWLEGRRATVRYPKAEEAGQIADLLRALPEIDVAEANKEDFEAEILKVHKIKPTSILENLERTENEDLDEVEVLRKEVQELRKETQETRSLLEKLFDWLKNIFE